MVKVFLYGRLYTLQVLCCFLDEGGLFSSKGLTDLKNAVGNTRSTLKSHDDSVDHKNAVAKDTNFISVCDGKKPSICSSLSKAYEDKVKRNP